MNLTLRDTGRIRAHSLNDRSLSSSLEPPKTTAEREERRRRAFFLIGKMAEEARKSGVCNAATERPMAAETTMAMITLMMTTRTATLLEADRGGHWQRERERGPPIFSSRSLPPPPPPLHVPPLNHRLIILHTARQQGCVPARVLLVRFHLSDIVTFLSHFSKIYRAEKKSLQNIFKTDPGRAVKEQPE